MLEYQQFNMVDRTRATSVESPADDRARWCKDWDRKMGEYETHANELVDAMKERHKDELTIFQENLLQKQQCPKV